MGNQIPKVQLRLDQIELIPGNVLIQVYNECKEAGILDSSLHCLVKGKVIRVASTHSNANDGHSKSMEANLSAGDEVWVRAQRGYPIETSEGERFYVVNEWDVAIRLKNGNGTAGTNAHVHDDECLFGDAHGQPCQKTPF